MAAYCAGRDLLETAPDVEEVRIFHEASAKTLNMRMRQASRAEDHVLALSAAQALLGDAVFSSSARDILLHTADNLPPPAAIACLLQASEQDASDEGKYWLAIAERLEALPPGAETINLAFEILAATPGHRPTLSLIETQLSSLAGTVPAAVAKIGLDATRILAKRISADQNVGERRAIYAEIRVACLPTAQTGPKPNEPDILWNRFAIEQAIERTEARIVPAQRAAPPDIWRLLDPASPHYALRDGLEPDDAAHDLFSAKSRPSPQGLAERANGILSLWLQSTNREASKDRIGYLWLVADPLIHVLIICAIPVIIHRTQIVDMNVFPFGVIGACFWLVFRTAAIGAMSGGMLTPQLEHPMVRRFDIIVARALNALVIYFFVGSTLLLGLMAAGQSAPPWNLPMFMLCFAVNWLLGLGYGLIGNSLLQFYPGFRRVNGFLMRLFGLTAGLFYVSEQMSDRISQWLLWNPLLHSVQLGRSYWFAEYTSRDSSWFYVLVWLAAIKLFALALLLRDERRIHGVRA